MYRFRLSSESIDPRALRPARDTLLECREMWASNDGDPGSRGANGAIVRNSSLKGGWRVSGRVEENESG